MGTRHGILRGGGATAPLWQPWLLVVRVSSWEGVHIGQHLPDRDTLPAELVTSCSIRLGPGHAPLPLGQQFLSRRGDAVYISLQLAASA